MIIESVSLVEFLDKFCLKKLHSRRARIPQDKLSERIRRHVIYAKISSRSSTAVYFSLQYFVPGHTSQAISSQNINCIHQHSFSAMMASRLARRPFGQFQALTIPSPVLMKLGLISITTASTARTFRPVTAYTGFARCASNVPSEDPKTKAQSILDSLPGNSLISKTAILSAGAGVSVWGISNEFLVLNEEAVVAFCLLSVFWAVGKYGGPMYKGWAEGQIEKMNGILNAAREDHTSAVKSRIENVKQMGSVVDVTKQLFEVSKVTI